MAGLVRYPGGSRNRGNNGREGKFYARVYIPRTGQSPKSKLIPLNTKNRREAELRKQEVERAEVSIKNGIAFEFPWDTGSPTSVKQTKIEELIPLYLRTRQIEGLRTRTLQTYELALSHFISSTGRNAVIENITANTIKEFVRKFRETHSITTLNINLRSIKTFLRWAKEEEHIQLVPTIKEIRQGTSPPRYLSTSEFHHLQDASPTFLADVFWFYRETGCRLREPFNAQVRGTYLIVSIDHSKGGEERQIPLNDDLYKIYRQLREADYAPKYYSEQFKLLAREAKVEGHKFHDLRHTFGVRTWLQTGDLHLVSQLMGHKSILTTQIYTKFFFSRLQEDFPDLAAFSNDVTKGRFGFLNKGR